MYKNHIYLPKKSIVLLFLGSLYILLNTSTANAQANITGELEKWHKITLTFDGVSSSEISTTNPFADYNLEVTFTNGSKSYVVPGYFAADGDAAETSASSGDKWRIHFAPDEIGTWNYSVSFTTGTDVAINGGGSSAGFMDGETGSFSVAATNKTGRDLRGKGRLTYVGEHYLQFQETGEWFMKAGADAPENTLAYEDFDDVPNRGNRRKNWSPHSGDYDAMEASAFTWQNGKGTELLGVVKYLSDKGMNAFSFLTFSLAGDDENVFPHLLKVDLATYNTYGDANQWDLGVHHDRFDVSRMAQWEKIFEYADLKGMYLHFKTQETENDGKMDGGAVDRERKLYYRELVARFGHHLALNWNMGEENTQSEQQRKDMAAYFEQIDPYNHNRVIHTYPGQKNSVYTPLLGNASEYTGASLQTSNSTYNEVFSDVLNWVQNSANNGKKWIVAVDEPGNASIGVDADPDDRKLVRNKVVWATMMAGGAGVEFYYGYQSGCGDLECQDHRTRDEKYTDASYALTFFQDHFQTYLPDVSNQNSITTASDDYVLGKTDEAYAVYLPNGGSTNITLPEGDWIVQWYNPRDGMMQSGNTEVTNSITAPDNNDWVALITANNCTQQILFIRGGTGTGGFLEGGSDEQLADITNFQTFNGNHGWGEFATTLENEGYQLTQLIENPNVPIDLTSININQYECVIFGSNNATYSTASIDELEAYVRAGGSALFISDANFGSNWGDAPSSDQDFLDRFGWTMNQDQGTYGLTTSDFLDPNHPIFISVTAFDGEGVSPITLSNTNVTGVTSTILARAKNMVRRNTGMAQGPSETPTNDDAALIIATVDDGRIAGHFDRNTFFNLNGAGTNINRFSNMQYAKNLINWLTDCSPPACMPGTACDDGDVCTENDVFDTNCDCAGTYQDSDNDGVCDAEDQCEGFDDMVDIDNDMIPDGCDPCDNTLEGTPCDDGDPNTLNDTIDANCNCVGDNGEIIVKLSPIHDAYLQGNGGTRFNTDVLRVEQNNRVSYLMFDISNIGGTITDANLEMTVAADPGNGTITVEEGDSNNWTEDNLSNSNKPNSVSTLASLNQSYTSNDSYTWNVGAISSNDGFYSMIVAHSNGNDVSFKSYENSDTNGRPVLCLTVSTIGNCTVGAACDDGDACTVNDTLDMDCNCVGIFQDSDNDSVCDADDLCDGYSDISLDIDNDPSIDSTYQAVDSIYSDAKINSGLAVNYRAGTVIVLGDGFEAEVGSIFSARLVDCTILPETIEEESATTEIEGRTAELIDVNSINIYPNPFSVSTTIQYELSTSSEVEITILDVTGKQISQLLPSSIQQVGIHQVTWISDSSLDGLFFVAIKIGERLEVRKLVLN